MLNKLVEPTILHLTYAIVRCYNTVNGNFITDGRLCSHSVISISTIDAIKTIDENCIGSISDVYITICKCSITIETGDCTGNIILLGGCCKCTKCESLLNSKSFSILGSNYYATFITLKIAVCISMLALRCGATISSNALSTNLFRTCESDAIYRFSKCNGVYTVCYRNTITRIFKHSLPTCSIITWTSINGKRCHSGECNNHLR